MHGDSVDEQKGGWSGRGVFNYPSTALGKCRALTGELRKSLLRSLLKRKKYRKLYLEALRNRNNISDRYQYVFNRQGVKVVRIPIYT